LSGDNLVSHTVFVWFMSILTAGVGGIYFVLDIKRLYQLRNADGKDPVVHDKRFGFGIGVLIGAIGVIGVLKYHLS
jgi:hypothetical protein